MSMMGGSGQWGRVRNDAGAKALQQEKQMDAERRQAATARSRAVREAVFRRIRSMFLPKRIG
ncbi:hypothetical protein KBX71_08375 [Micromonospora sp. D93]|uniref:hypothetical protein n=1 Tax=Micromonospora sp. D93 TaxID=2824886 RepID=UPI001B393798|nr:hypothetical protein [Micromonospora sp. D93]MBQ1017878.1 hypothetical protein [Micromonospora sp. D93]